MINFIDEKGVKHSAIVECKKTKGVNGEKSLSGTIYTNEKILEGIGRGWRLEFENEKYCLTYVYPIDEGNQIVVEFDAVHEFFFDLNKKVVYSELNGSNTAKAYLDLIFNGSGYSYLIEVNIPAFEKEGFGMRNRLDLFKEFISDTGVEFSVSGKVVRILEKVGSNLSTIVKKGFNLNELRIEKDPGSFITYKKGFGAWHDDDDHSKGRLEVEYLSPLASIYGKLEGDPIVDERYKVASNFETRLKNDVESSYGISVDIDMEDLTKAGYEYEQPHEGDYIMAINKDLGFEQKIRIMSYETSYDTNGNIIDHKVACGSDNIIRKSTKEDDDFRKEIQAGLEGAISTSNKAWVSANGKNAVFEGPDEPTATAIGDTWFQIDGDKKIMRIWNGYEWKPVFNPGEIENKIDQAEKDIAQNIIDIESTLGTAEQSRIDAGFATDIAKEAKELGVTASTLAGEATTNANKAMTDAQEAIRQVVLNGGVAADASAEATEAKRLAGLAEDNAQEALTKANASVTDASKALTDATKAFNKSFKSSAVAYATSTNGSTPPTTGWLSTVPTPSPDVYIWTRTTILLNDNTPVVSYSVGKIGAKGDQGLKGDTGGQGIQGLPGVNAPTITSVVQQFYLSTSTTTQTGGSWLSTVPVWSSGKYYWVRVVTTYSNGTNTTSTPVLDNALNDSLVTALEVKTANQSLSSTVTQHATLIEGKASSTTVDAIAGRVTTTEGSISTIAGQVALKASTADVNTLTGRVTTAEGNITTQAGQIALKANSSDVDTLTGRVTTAEGTITAQAGQIALRATTATVNTLTGRVSTAEGKITTQAGLIELKADTTTVNTLTGRVSAAEASISVQSGKIDLAATKTELTTAINGIQVGGRNLIVNTESLDGYSYKTSDKYMNFNIARTKKGSTGYSDTFSAKTIGIAEGDTYTASFFARTSVASVIVCHWYSPNTTKHAISSTGQVSYGIDGGIQVTTSTDWKRYWVTWTQSTTTAVKHLIIGRNTTTAEGTIVEIAGVKIEKGNKSTDWTPAPEDVDSAISTVQANLTVEAGKIASKVSQTDFNVLTGRVSTAEGKITTQAGQIDLKANNTTVNTLTGRVTTAEGNITTQAGLIALKANQSVVDTLTGRVTTTESKITATDGKVTTLTTKTDGHTTSIGLLETNYSGLNSTVTQVKNNLDGMEIGGRNLWLNSSAKDSFSGWGTSGTKTLDSTVLLNGEPTIKFVSPSTSTGGMVKTVTGRLGPNTVFTYSFMVKSSVSIPIHSSSIAHMQVVGTSNPSNLHREQNMKYSPTSVPANEWTKVSVTFNTPVEAVTGETFEFRSYLWYVPANAVLYFGEFKLERGNVATAYSPAPEDYTTVIAFSALEQSLDGFKTTVQNTYADKTTVTQLAGQWTTTTNLVDGHSSQIASLGTDLNLRATKTEVAESILADKTIKDTRTTNQLPPWYYTNYPRQKAYEFKRCSVIGLPSSAGYYASVVTEVPWNDASGGPIEQTATATDGVYQRRGSTTWSAWAKVANSSNIVSQINISPESILIASNKIQIKGDTYIDNGVIKTAHIADLAVSGAKIANASIASAKIISLDASKITVGTLTGHTINGAFINGGSINGANITGGTFYNSGSRGDFHVYDGMVKATSYNTVADGTILSEDGYITLRAGGTGSGSHVFLQSVTEVRATRPREFSTYIPMVASGFRMPGWTYLARNVWSTYGNGIEDMFIKPSDIGSLRVMSAGNGSYRPIMASAFNQSSSRRFKENIKRLQESGLEAIRGFNIVTYNLKDDPNKETQVGLIAEDNRTISSFEGDSINIYKMTSYNSKAIQELDTGLQNLNKRINTTDSNVIKLVANDSIYGLRLNNLESEVFRLKKRIEELEKIA